MKNRQVLIVDDEAKMRRVLEIALQQMGCQTFSAANGIEALQIIDHQLIDLIITDLRMPEMNGLELLGALRARDSSTPVMVITAHGTVETAVEAMRQGAVDYLMRPFDIDALEMAIRHVLDRADAARQNQFLKEEIDKDWGGFVGSSPAMRSIFDQILQVGPTKASVLLLGETGTGKELAARAIHQASARRDSLFVPINCAAVPADMLESELFGYERGAFTGAVKDRVGKFEYADGGTIFLDEITEMPLALQSKLLRVLQEGTVERLGSNRSKQLDIRLIAATNRDPLQAVEEARLREDVYYRLNVFSIEMPPLRARPEDIEPLVKHFIKKHSGAGASPRMEATALERMQSYGWPGNVRELENTIERALILSQGGPLTERHFSLERRNANRPGRADVQVAGAVPASRSLTDAVDELEAKMIDDALLRAEGNKAKAAAWLEISERTLWYKLKKRRIDV